MLLLFLSPLKAQDHVLCLGNPDYSDPCLVRVDVILESVPAGFPGYLFMNIDVNFTDQLEVGNLVLNPNLPNQQLFSLSQAANPARFELDYAGNPSNLFVPGQLPLTLFTIELCGAPGQSDFLSLPDGDPILFPLRNTYSFLDDPSNPLSLKNEAFSFCLLGRFQFVNFDALEISGQITKPPFSTATCEGSANNGIPGIDVLVEDNTCEEPCSDGIACQTTTGSGGNYGCELLRGLDYTIRPYKDDDVLCGDPAVPNNAVNAVDIGIIQQAVLQIDHLDYNWQKIAADVNDDGVVSTFDALLIQQVIAGSASQFVLPSWVFVPVSDYNLLSFNNDNIVPSYPVAIELTNLQMNTSGLDFLGIKAGDVDGSCSDCQGTDAGGGGSSGLQEDETAIARQSSQYRNIMVSAERLDLRANQILNLNIALDRLEEETVWSLQWLIDQDYLELVSATSQALPAKGTTLIGEKAPGLLQAIWVAEEKPEGAEVSAPHWLSIRLRAKQDIADIRTHFRAGQDIKNNLAFRADGSYDPLQIIWQASENDFWVFPNPAKEQFSLEWEQQTAGEVSIQLLDQHGKTVKSWQHAAEAGTQRLQYTLQGIPAGAYTIIVEQGSTQRSTLPLIIH